MTNQQAYSKFAVSTIIANPTKAQRKANKAARQIIEANKKRNGK